MFVRTIEKKRNINMLFFLCPYRQFEWTYVSIVYSDTEYGKHGYETLVSLANKYSVCFSAPQRIDKDRFLPEDYDNVIRTITNKTEVRGKFDLTHVHDLNLELSLCVEVYISFGGFQ
jgi:hypothetical protein